MFDGADFDDGAILNETPEDRVFVVSTCWTMLARCTKAGVPAGKRPKTEMVPGMASLMSTQVTAGKGCRKNKNFEAEATLDAEEAEQSDVSSDGGEEKKLKAMWLALA
eukprot:2679773-Amphidinium_carterae.4